MAVATLDDSMVRIQCPKCRYGNVKAIWWLRKNREMFCDGCQAVILLEISNTGFRIFEIERARHRLQQALATLDRPHRE